MFLGNKFVIIIYYFGLFLEGLIVRSMIGYVGPMFDNYLSNGIANTHFSDNVSIGSRTDGKRPT